MENNNCYVYRHIRLDTNLPFYIGIGSKRKRNFKTITAEYERAYSKTGRNKYWKNIINKCGYSVQIVLDNLTLDEAKLKEIEFISIYGRKDLEKKLLCNKTNGADFPSENALLKVKKKIINIKSGKIFESVKNIIIEDNLEIEEYNLRRRLSGKVKNNTDYIYLDCDKEEYFKKQSNIKQKGESVSKQVIDKETGKIFKSIIDASLFFNINRNNLNAMLRGKRVNHTKLEYLNNEIEVEENKKLLEVKMFNNKRKRKIIDIESNEIFTSIKKAADSLNMKYTTLNEMLLGRNKNKTNFRYLDNN